MKTGLVLEGGAMRGMFTAGAMDVMMEAGIEFDGLIGVSAGATFGCNYKSKQIGRAIRYNKRFCKDWRYASVRSLLLTGDMFGAEFCYKTLPDELDVFDVPTYRANPMEFYIVATDVETGKPYYRACPQGGAPDIQWFRASASMPLASRVVELEGRKFLDGGIADSIPLRAFEEMGYARNVVILTQPRNFVKEKNSMLPLMKIMLGKYPNLIHTIAHRHEVYNEETAYVKKREQEGCAFVLCPEEPLGISHVVRDPDELERVYQIGRKTAEKHLEEMKKFMEASHGDHTCG